MRKLFWQINVSLDRFMGSEPRAGLERDAAFAWYLDHGEKTMGVTFPNETPEYQGARAALLKREVALRREMETVAALLAQQRARLAARPKDAPLDLAGNQ